MHSYEWFTTFLREQVPWLWSGEKIAHRTLRQSKNCLAEEPLTDGVLTESVFDTSYKVVGVDVGVAVDLIL